MSDMMTFPETWEEFEKSYGFNDSEEIYTNGSRLIPSFRVKQWLDHIAQSKSKQQATISSDCISKNQSLIEWKEYFKDFVEGLDIPRDDYNGIMEYIDEVPSAEPEPMCINLKLTDLDKPIGDGRPLADSEVIPRLQDIKRQIGGSYAIERAIEVLENLPSAPTELSNNSPKLDNENGELIYRQDAVKKMYDLCEYIDDESLHIDVIVDALENLPFASTDISTFSDKLWKIAYERGKAEGRKKGKWIKDRERFGDNAYHCNQCGAVLEKDNLEWRNNYYCYHCGADMREGDEE